ncbi:MAG: SMC-Scp complex subunit ScpB [Desulfobacterales bacterium]|nr:SMC-Scp complex subunit ScpB [Desulfobacterales bacterium]
MDDIKNIIESLLFVAEEPLTIDRLKKIISGVETKELREALEELEADYETRQGGFFLNQVAGGYQIRTRPEYMEWIKRLLQPKPSRLSKAALETLAIIAYKQPVIRSDIEHIRGVDCGGVLRVLLERYFIRVLGRKEIAGRPLIYATTKRFLEVFDLKNLKDLPTPKEIEEFGSSLSENMNETANEDQPEPEISTATDGEETETPLETVEPELPTENLQTSTEVEEAKPDQDV